MPASTLIELDHSGHTELIWTSSNEAEVAAARAHFDALRAKGYLATRRAPDGTRETIHEFDPNAETITMQPQTVGG